MAKADNKERLDRIEKALDYLGSLLVKDGLINPFDALKFGAILRGEE